MQFKYATYTFPRSSGKPPRLLETPVEGNRGLIRLNKGKIKMVIEKVWGE